MSQKLICCPIKTSNKELELVGTWQWVVLPLILQNTNSILLLITALRCMRSSALYSRQCSWRWCSPSGGLRPTVAGGPECDHLWGQIFKTSRSKVTFTNTRDTHSCIAWPCAAIFSHAWLYWSLSPFSQHFDCEGQSVFTLNSEI